jgi:hypothetical protein
MRFTRWIPGLLLALAPLLAAGGAFDMAYRSAMGSYYAALLASARRDADATVRHVMLLKSRWEAVIRISDTDAPPPLRDDPGWRAALTRVAAQADRARQLASKRDTVGAHAELEAIRGILHEARTRSGVRMFDDDLTEYHEAIERLSGLVGTRNEFRLKAEDFDAIKQQTERARRAWATVDLAANSVNTQPAWRDASARTAAALAALEKAVEAQDSAGVIRAGEQLHAHYFELLAALSGA